MRRKLGDVAWLELICISDGRPNPSIQICATDERGSIILCGRILSIICLTDGDTKDGNEKKKYALSRFRDVNSKLSSFIKLEDEGALGNINLAAVR